MKNIYKVISGVLGVIIVLFLVREFSLSKNKELIILAEKNVVLIQTSSKQILSFGDTETSFARTLLRSIQSYFSRAEILKIEEQKENKEFRGEDFRLSVLSKNIFNFESDSQRFWLIGKITEEELMNLRALSISFSSDFWVLKTNDFPDFFPLPDQGILYLGERKPAKKVEKLAKENKIPLITIKETGGFSLEFLGGEWKLRTR